MGARACVMKIGSLFRYGLPLPGYSRFGERLDMGKFIVFRPVHKSKGARLARPSWGSVFRPSTRLPCANAGVSRRIYVLMRSHHQQLNATR